LAEAGHSMMLSKLPSTWPGNQNGFVVTVFGQPVESNQLTLLPGMYQLAAPNNLISWAGPQILVTTPGQSLTVDLPGPTLAPGAAQAMGAAAQAKMAACLSEASVVTSCGFGAQNTYDQHPGDPQTIHWATSPSGLDLSASQWQLVSNVAAASLTTPVTLSMTYDDPSSSYAVSVSNGVVAYIGDPGNIVVEFTCADVVAGCDTLVSQRPR
jgi:hypothetical protein